MRKIFIILLLPILLAFNTTISNLKLEVISTQTQMINDVTHTSITSNMYNDKNIKTPQNINVLKSNGKVQTTIWSTVATDGTLINTNVLDIARNFERLNPGYEVIAGVNGDYFTTNQTINANMVHGGYMINPNNHEKFLSLELNSWGNLIDTHKKVTSKNLYAYFYDQYSNALLYATELLPINSRIVKEGETVVYYNYEQLDEISHDFYSFDIKQKSILSTHMMFRLVNGIFQNGKIPKSSYDVSIKSLDTKVNEILAQGVHVKIQQNLSKIRDSHTMLGVDSMILDNGNVRAFIDIGGQGESNNINRHPRTAIGFDLNNNPILVTVDGRQQGISSGVDLRELAHILKESGAVYGFNLDGGGSTQAFIKKDNDFVMVNKPSDGSYRRVSNAVLFIKPKDNHIINLTEDNDYISFELPSNDYKVLLDNQPYVYNDLNVKIKKDPYKDQSLSIVKKSINYAVLNDVIYKTKEKEPILPTFEVKHEIDNLFFNVMIYFDDPELLIDRMYVINSETQDRKVALVSYKGLRKATFEIVPENNTNYEIFYELKNGMKGKIDYLYIINEEDESSALQNSIQNIAIASSVITIVLISSIIIIKRKRR